MGLNEQHSNIGFLNNSLNNSSSIGGEIKKGILQEIQELKDMGLQ